MSTAAQTPAPSAFSVPPKTMVFNFFADVKMHVRTLAEGYQVMFTVSDKDITTYSSKTAPWQSLEIERKMLSQLHDSLEGERKLDKGVLKEKLHSLLSTISEQLGTNPATKLALSSPVVQKVIDNTSSVEITPGDPPIYCITLLGRKLHLTPDDLNGSPRKLNAAWLEFTWIDQLDATKTEYRAIVTHWLEMAVLPDKDTEPVTDMDMCLERFLLLLPTIPISENKSSLIDGKYGWIEKNNGTVDGIWIPATIVEEFLDEQKKDSRQKSIFRALLYSECIITEKTSRPVRFAPGKSGVRRCWPINPEYVLVGAEAIRMNAEGQE